MKILAYRIVQLCAFMVFVAGSLNACSHTEEISASSQKSQTVQISGKTSILESSASTKGLTVSINGTPVVANAQGVYKASTKRNDIYQIRISGGGVFESVHTFSHAELSVKEDASIEIPNINLVEKIPGRTLMVFGGDAMMGRRYLEPKWGEDVLIKPETRLKDMKAILAGMRPYFEPADLSGINLETVLSTNELPESAPKNVVFYTHPDILEALKWMGADYVSLGNNHTYDYVAAGIDTTLAALERSGLGYSGAGRNQAEALQAYQTSINGTDIGILGFVGWKGRVTPNQVAEINKGGAAYGSTENIVSAVTKEAQEDELIVVQYHGSREYSEEPTEITEQRLKAAVDAGADLIIGHHPHVAHGLELYKDKLIAYSLGNFAFDQFFYETHGAYILKVWMDGEDFHRAEIVPIHIKDYKPVPATSDMRQYILKRIISLSAKRGTHVSLSGGHGVITAKNKAPVFKTVLREELVSGGDNVIELWQSVAQQYWPVEAKLENETGIQPVFGMDLFMRGDFESYSLYGTGERTFEAKNAKSELTETSRTGNYAMKIMPTNENEPARLAQKIFMRVLPSNSLSFTGYLRSEGNVHVTGYAQYRPRPMNRYKALEEAPLVKLGEAILEGDDWQNFKFDFIPPNKVQRTVRVLLEFRTFGKNIHPIFMDDLAVIAWEENSENKPTTSPNRRTHVFITVANDKPNNGKISIMYEKHKIDSLQQR
ncbi:MAG: hypothetical protein COA91_13330 [Robiginitomaculum sp.]|nr:MAG: hypothetical protein COA91_13330 [Robiginitomaculum sp.]